MIDKNNKNDSSSVNETHSLDSTENNLSSNETNDCNETSSDCNETSLDSNKSSYKDDLVVKKEEFSKRSYVKKPISKNFEGIDVSKVDNELKKLS